MNKRIIIGGLIAVVIVSSSVILFSKKDNTKSGRTTDHSMNSNKVTNDQPGQNQIFIKGFAFGPNKISVKKGTKITWTNKDDAHHDITPDKDYSNAFSGSKLLANGESYSYTFDTIGSYNYHCSPHPYIKATIEVTE